MARKKREKSSREVASLLSEGAWPQVRRVPARDKGEKGGIRPEKSRRQLFEKKMALITARRRKGRPRQADPGGKEGGGEKRGYQPRCFIPFSKKRRPHQQPITKGDCLLREKGEKKRKRGQYTQLRDYSP